MNERGNRCGRSKPPASVRQFTLNNPSAFDKSVRKDHGLRVLPAAAPRRQMIYRNTAACQPREELVPLVQPQCPVSFAMQAASSQRGSPRQALHRHPFDPDGRRPPIDGMGRYGWTGRCQSRCAHGTAHRTAFKQSGPTCLGPNGRSKYMDAASISTPAPLTE